MNKKKLLALVLAALMSVSTTVVAFADESTPAATQNAGITVLSENKTLSTNLSDFGTIKAGGDYQEFTVTTGGEDDLSTYVFGKFLINGAEPVFGEGAPYSIQYYETQSPWEGWHDLESNYFGPTETGFPFKTGLTSKFQVKFNEPGTYKIEIQLVKKDAPSEVIVTTGETEVKVTPENITPVKDESGLKDALAEGGYVMLSQNITLTNPILGKAVFDGFAGCSVAHVFAVKIDFAAFFGGRAEKHRKKRCTSRTVKPGNAYNLALSRRKRHVL